MHFMLQAHVTRGNQADTADTESAATPTISCVFASKTSFVVVLQRTAAAMPRWCWLVSSRTLTSDIDAVPRFILALGEWQLSQNRLYK
jgi:hypothetical protein